MLCLQLCLRPVCRVVRARRTHQPAARARVWKRDWTRSPRRERARCRRARESPFLQAPTSVLRRSWALAPAVRDCATPVDVWTWSRAFCSTHSLSNSVVSMRSPALACSQSMVPEGTWSRDWLSALVWRDHRRAVAFVPSRSVLAAACAQDSPGELHDRIDDSAQSIVDDPGYANAPRGGALSSHRSRY